MNLYKVARWEFRRSVMSKGFLIMTVIIPAIIMIAVFLFTSIADGGSAAKPAPSYVLAVFLSLLLVLGAFISGIIVFYGVLKEKGSRVVELVLSSVSSNELMTGKIIGLGMAGLIQVVVLVLTSYFVAGRFMTISLSVLSPLQLVTYPLYFVFGHLLVATLYATAASTMKDVHSGGPQGAVGLVFYLPMMFFPAIIEHPDLTWIHIAGFFPPFIPAVMMIRMAVSKVAWWEVALSLAILVVSVLLLMRFAAKVFEVAMLMYGKTASLREIWRWGVRRHGADPKE